MNLPAIAMNTLQEVQTFSAIAFKSGLFTDIKQESQAFIKVMAGIELGIGPIASLRGLYVQKGEVATRANLAAALIKRSGKYDYRVREHVDDHCTLEFFEHGESVGHASFSMKDAERAGLLKKDNWRAYPFDMLYARAMTRGAREFCPDVFIGSIYDPDELDTSFEEAITYETVSDEEDDLDDHGKYGNAEGQRDLNAPPDDPATEKQRAYVLGLLKQCGIPEGYKRLVFNARYPNGASKDALKLDIEHLQQTKTLPNAYFGKLIELLRGDAGLDTKDIVTYCQETFGRDKPFGLTPEQQIQLIDDLQTAAQEEQTLNRISLLEAYRPMFAFLAEKAGCEEDVIARWFADCSQHREPEALRAWMEGLSLEDLKGALERYIDTDMAATTTDDGADHAL